MAKKKWKHIPADGIFNAGPGNYILEGDGFYVSYAPDTSGSFLARSGDADETALCKDGTFLILKGDWRKQYEPLVDQGYEACVALFRANEAGHRSQWSNSTPKQAAH